MKSGEAPDQGRRSRIVEAVSEVQDLIGGEIHVHLSQRFIEPNVFRQASRVFTRMGLDRTAAGPVILFYLNLRYRKFAVVGNQKANQILSPDGWNEIAAELRSQLLSTHYERAIAGTIRFLSRLF